MNWPKDIINTMKKLSHQITQRLITTKIHTLNQDKSNLFLPKWDPFIHVYKTQIKHNYINIIDLKLNKMLNMMIKMIQTSKWKILIQNLMIF